MNLSERQSLSLADLIADAECMTELYWDTDNGHKLSRSLDAVRVAFVGLERSQRPAPNVRQPRLVIEAQCAICGPLDDQGTDELSTLKLAIGHTSALGHVVILNGTADLPRDDEDLAPSS